MLKRKSRACKERNEKAIQDEVSEMQNTPFSSSISLDHDDSESTDQVLLLEESHMTCKIRYKLIISEDFFLVYVVFNQLSKQCERFNQENIRFVYLGNILNMNLT